MINQTYLNKLIRLIGNGVLTIEDIKEEAYKIEVKAQLQVE